MRSLTFPGSGKTLFPRGPGVGLKTLALILMALGLMITDHRSRSLDGIRETLSTLMRPLFWATAVPRQTADTVSGLRGWLTLQSENSSLQQELFQLQSQLQRFEALQAENSRIRELLSASTQLEDKVLIAEILSAAQNPYRHQIILDKGARDGVYRGQALVDASGVLGQVVKVQAKTSTALLITDPNHGIPVEFNRTGLQTIALGRGDGQRLSLPYLPSNADVKVGDKLVSSALGGRFPAGYPVGEVIELKPGQGDNFMEALARPAARINHGRQALLVWSESYTVPEPAPEETPPSAKTAPTSEP